MGPSPSSAGLMPIRYRPKYRVFWSLLKPQLGVRQTVGVQGEAPATARRAGGGTDRPSPLSPPTVCRKGPTTPTPLARARARAKLVD
jgi:hypothetical protein